MIRSGLTHVRSAGALCAVLVGGLLAACGANGTLTNAVLTPADAAPPALRNDPTARAFGVGSSTARAVKCGFNFDPAKLKANFLAAEAQVGATPEDLAKIEKTYDISYASMSKVIAAEPNYCSEEKTKYIKADLAQHLAGDFTPRPLHPKREDGEGLFTFGGEGAAPVSLSTNL